MYHYSLQANLSADCDLVLLRASDMVLARNISCCHDYYLCYKISTFHQTEQNYGPDTHLDLQASYTILACEISSCLDNHPVCKINLNSHNAGQSYGPEHEHVTLKSRKENTQTLAQLSSRSHPRNLVGKRTAQKDTIIDITSDSQVNSNFSYRRSPASLTFKYLFLPILNLYIT